MRARAASAAALLVASLCAIPARTARADPTDASNAASAPAPAVPVLPPAWAAPAIEKPHFAIDPVADGVFVGGTAGLAITLALVIGTGEIQPTAPGPTGNLLPLDRLAVTQHVDPHAALWSNVGVYTAVGFAVLDPILAGLRDGPRATLVDGMLYAESISTTEALTELTKIAVRRPRPIDYTCTAACGIGDQLSFFSGHTALVAAVGATATTLAFTRAKGQARPWITLGVATALTAFVATERVRSGEHFPTDVLAGSMVGAATGVLVPYLHRRGKMPLVVGAGPAAGRGGAMSLAGAF